VPNCLADLADPWPREFNTHYTIHGQLHVGERITLLDVRLAETTALNQASRYLSATLALGEHPWPVCGFLPARPALR
jgi:hypothetical protein